VSGGNIDSTLIDRIIRKGLVTSGRMGVFEVTLDDVPGSLHVITGIISSRRGNILNVFHDRYAGALPIGQTKVLFTVEIRRREHLEEILSDLRAKGLDVREDPALSDR
jgi:threonine dehydratase